MDAMRFPSDDIEAIQASMLRGLASPQRLRIIRLLGGRPRDVTTLARELGLAQAATSQHLAALRAAGLVVAVRDGRTVHYDLADPGIEAACALMRDVLVRRLSRLGALAASDRHQPAGSRTAGSRTAGGPTPGVTHP
jgi:ArsR family transcriptional regulator